MNVRLLRVFPSRDPVSSTRSPGALIVVAMFASLVVAAGCATMAGRPSAPLDVKRENPGVVLSTSERTAAGGIRIIGRLDPGIHPITRASIEYRLAGPSDAPPTSPDPSGRLALAGARSEQVRYEKGSKEVVYAIDPRAVRNLGDKVIWYRWIITYNRGGSAKADVTDVLRTSAEEAGLPRSVTTPGPDTSVALPTTGRR